MVLIEASHGPSTTKIYKKPNTAVVHRQCRHDSRACNAGAVTRQVFPREKHRIVVMPLWRNWNRWDNTYSRAVCSRKCDVDTNAPRESSPPISAYSCLLCPMRHRCKRPLDLMIQRIEPSRSGIRFSTDNQITTTRQQLLVPFRQYTKPTFHSIPRNSVTYGFGYGKTQPTLVGMILILMHQIMHHDISATHSMLPRFNHGDEIPMGFQPFHRL